MKLDDQQLERVCACGAPIWSCQHERHLPKYAELMVCPGCGADHSRRPTVLYRLGRLKFQVIKRRRLFGALGVFRNGLKSLWWLDRELDEEMVADAFKRHQDRQESATTVQRAPPAWLLS